MRQHWRRRMAFSGIRFANTQLEIHSPSPSEVRIVKRARSAVGTKANLHHPRVNEADLIPAHHGDRREPTLFDKIQKDVRLPLPPGRSTKSVCKS